MFSGVLAFPCRKLPQGRNEPQTVPPETDQCRMYSGWWHFSHPNKGGFSSIFSSLGKELCVIGCSRAGDGIEPLGREAPTGLKPAPITRRGHPREASSAFDDS